MVVILFTWHIRRKASTYQDLEYTYLYIKTEEVATEGMRADRMGNSRSLSISC